MSNVHGISQPTNGTSPPISSTTINNTKTIKRNGSNSIRLKQTPQVQLRVTCQVCKKVKQKKKIFLISNKWVFSIGIV